MCKVVNPYQEVGESLRRLLMPKKALTLRFMPGRKDLRYVQHTLRLEHCAENNSTSATHKYTRLRNIASFFAIYV